MDQSLITAISSTSIHGVVHMMIRMNMVSCIESLFGAMGRLRFPWEDATTPFTTTKQNFEPWIAQNSRRRFIAPWSSSSQKRPRSWKSTRPWKIELPGRNALRKPCWKKLLMWGNRLRAIGEFPNSILNTRRKRKVSKNDPRNWTRKWPPWIGRAR